VISKPLPPAPTGAANANASNAGHWEQAAAVFRPFAHFLRGFSMSANAEIETRRTDQRPYTDIAEKPTPFA
jgi:hypothetical protein